MRYKGIKCKMIKKKCRLCNSIKSVHNFHKRSESKDGYRRECKTCRKETSLRHKNICTICGSEFLSSRTNAKFCSKECRSFGVGEIQKEMYKDRKIKFKCDNCNKEVVQSKKYYEKHKTHFCSKECMQLYNKRTLTSRLSYNCDYCRKEIKIHMSKFKRNNRHFCSKECYGNSMSGINSPKWKRVSTKCGHCNKEIEIPDWNCKRSERHFCSKECKYEWQKENLKGENNPFWNPDLTDEERLNSKQRYLNPLYREWMKKVYARDCWTCQCCGIKAGENINAHHLNGYNWDKENRTNIDNGITLCEDCHKDFHKTYGYGNNTREQFEEWINNKLQNAS